MELPQSKSQIERLGKRLIEPERPAPDDLTKRSDLLLCYDEALASAIHTVRDPCFEPTGRVKNTATILEKLRRDGGSWLTSIQDLAGIRIVLDGGRRTG